MRKIKPLALLVSCTALIASLAGCAGTTTQKSSSETNSAASGTITDILGNKVKLPDKITKIYATSPIGAIMLYTLDPDKMISWDIDLTPAMKKFINTKYQNLPMIGNTGTQFNTEEIIKQKPDLILDVAQQSQVDASVKQLAAQTGVPVVEFDASFAATAKNYKLLGQILGKQSQANKLADYITKKSNNILSLMKKVPKDKQETFYYAESSDGLKTDGSDSMHTELFKYLGLKNVVTVNTSQNMKGTSVSMEQVLNWNPSVIIASSKMGGDQFVKSVYSNSSWSNITAVKNHKVYSTPVIPFDWFDRPPSVMRLLGAEWLAKTIYPDYIKIDMVSEAKSFFSEFFGVNLSDSDVKSLLGDIGS